MRRYPGKLLLFGEYLLLLGAPALAVPLPAYAGQWAWPEPTATLQPDFTETLLRWARSESLGRVEGLDIAAFVRDLRQGLYFSSNIPTGYGLGSSGALCAAVYDRYAAERPTDPGLLKGVLATMESFFHGQSSGLDPLTSYTGQPLLLEHKTRVRFFTGQPWADPPAVFLLDTGMPRQTGPLVQWFLAQYASGAFRTRVEQELWPAHTRVLQAWEDGKAAAFWPAIRELSGFQLDHMKPMIPDSMQNLWKGILTEEKMAFKICGAGGGGFMLGFARKAQDIESLAQKFPIIYPLAGHGPALG